MLLVPGSILKRFLLLQFQIKPSASRQRLPILPRYICVEDLFYRLLPSRLFASLHNLSAFITDTSMNSHVYLSQKLPAPFQDLLNSPFLLVILATITINAPTMTKTPLIINGRSNEWYRDKSAPLLGGPISAPMATTAIPCPI